MHQINNNEDHTSGLREGIDFVQAEQKAGKVGHGYVFSGDDWLGAGVWYANVPPAAHIWYVVVPPNGDKPYFHYGMDSMAHPDIIEYVKWIKTLNLW
jgi:hypothetical protein